MNEYTEVCKHCGAEFRSITEMKRGFTSSCPSPSRSHEPFEKGIQDKYICKHCGNEYKSLRQMFSGFSSSCPSPTKRHEPLNR